MAANGASYINAYGSFRTHSQSKSGNVCFGAEALYRGHLGRDWSPNEWRHSICEREIALGALRRVDEFDQAKACGEADDGSEVSRSLLAAEGDPLEAPGRLSGTVLRHNTRPVVADDFKLLPTPHRG